MKNTLKMHKRKEMELLLMLKPCQDHLFSERWEKLITTICVICRCCVFVLKCVILPFFIRVLTWSTRGSMRSWAMERTLLGPTGFTLIIQKRARIKRAAPFKLYTKHKEDLQFFLSKRRHQHLQILPTKTCKYDWMQTKSNYSVMTVQIESFWF